MTRPRHAIALGATLGLVFLHPDAALLAQQTAPRPGVLTGDARDAVYLPGPKAEATGDRVMVSTQLAVVTEAALEVLREGGNAVDAAITATFMQHVHDYHQVSIFGAISGLYYEAATGTYHAFNGMSERPRADRGERGDASIVAIGGTVRTLEALAKRFGTRPWASYLEPAIRSADDGPLVTSFMYGNTFATMEGDLAQHREVRAFFMPDGHLVPVGHRWKMPALAATLRRVATEGADYMYTGEWGQKFVKEATKRGGRVTLDDMAEYETRWSEPVRFTYRGHEIVTEPAPNKGGLIVAYNLNVLEHFDLKSLGHYSDSPEALEVMARVFGRVEDEMRFAFEDPLSFRNPVDLWLSKEYGRWSAEFVRQTMRLPGVNLAPPAPTTADASAAPSAGPATAPSVGSNHNVIVDAQGNWISFLHTMHGGTPGVFIDGVQAVGSRVRSRTAGPGRRILAEVTGTFVARDGRPWLSLGTPGFPPQPVTEVLVNLLDHGMTPGEAAAAPRFWAFLNNDREVRIESRISQAVRDGMAAAGIKVKELVEYDWHVGSMQIVWRDRETGRLHGVTDPRRLGHAAGF